jgi:HEAT repeat protein
VQRDGSDDARRAAVEAIAAMRHPRSAAILRGVAIEGRSASVRQAAAEALGEIEVDPDPKPDGIEAIDEASIQAAATVQADAAAHADADHEISVDPDDPEP